MDSSLRSEFINEKIPAHQREARRSCLLLPAFSGFLAQGVVAGA